MVPQNTLPIIKYVGTGTASSFAIPFPTFDANTLVIQVMKLSTGDLIDLEVNTDYVLTRLGIPNQSAQITLKDLALIPPFTTLSQEWMTAGKLKAGYTLYVQFSDEAYQSTNLAELGSAAPAAFSKAVDKLTMFVKALWYKSTKAISIREADVGFFDPELPSTDGQEGKVLQINDAGTGLEWVVNAADAAAESGLPVGYAVGDNLEFADVMGTTEPVYTHVLYDGISALTGAQFTAVGVKDALDKIIRITYTPPQISLSSSPSSGTVREKGTVVGPTDLTANYVKKSNNIAAVRFYRAGALINTATGINPAGGTATYQSTPTFSDNLTFSAQVDDVAAGGSGPSTSSSSITFTFVYPYYSGAAAPGRTPAQVAALTKDVRTSTGSLGKSFTSVNGDVYYFAYPASYGALTSIKDVNNFETIGDWTLTTANITGLDGNAVSYRIYAFNNPVVAGTTSYTFTR